MYVGVGRSKGGKGWKDGEKTESKWGFGRARTGNNLMNISLSTLGWTPAGAATYLTVTWDQEGTVVAAGDTVQGIITLDVLSGITGISDFSFNIVIEGTG